jgi:hypothetical protein
MLNEAFGLLEEDVITFFPNLVIMHFGIVEVSARRTIRPVNNKTIVNYYTNRYFYRPFTFPQSPYSFFVFLSRAVNSLVRRFASIFGLKWQWLSTKRFLMVMRSMLETIIKETNAHIIVIGVSPCSERVESILDGTRENIGKMNKGMEDLCKELGDRIHYLDPSDFMMDRCIEELVPDGIHFSAEGHRLLADKLLQLMHDI